MTTQARTGAVLIGRNEGARLVGCLASIAGQVTHAVYVDSGSTDDSVANAEAAGVEVVTLDLSKPFTAARARNAGFEALLADQPDLTYVQFVDGDCEVQPDWITTAATFLDANPQAAVACGRRRERYPDASVYNRLCDWEWDTPVGPAKACGGDALMRVEAFREVEGFNPSLICGEEPELCLRMRGKGWEIWRLDAEMTLHDAAMTRFGQWWIRSRRSGHAWAEGMALHGGPPERHGVAGTVRALAWGLVLPLIILMFALLVTPWALLLLLAYPAQVVRLALRDEPSHKTAWERATFMTLVKFPETLGVLGYWLKRLTQRPATLIEYK